MDRTRAAKTARCVAHRQSLNYLVNQREPLCRFLSDGRLRLDNNLSELELRRQVVGRANWTFCGSDDGAEWNAIATSLIASCKLHDIEPWAYLRDVLTHDARAVLLRATTFDLVS
jgi:hypothetical protein